MTLNKKFLRFSAEGVFFLPNFWYNNAAGTIGKQLTEVSYGISTASSGKRKPLSLLGEAGESNATDRGVFRQAITLISKGTEWHYPLR